MRRSRKKHIFVVDDKRQILREIREILEDAGYNVSCFIRAADCLKQLEQSNGTSCNLLITDERMPKMTGMELLTKCQRLYGWMPVLFITGFGTKNMAFKAGKRGAEDFIDKPFTRQYLLSRVKSVLKRDEWDNPLFGKILTKRQIEVMRLILQGLSNKEIGIRLKIVLRTVEDHCNQIYKRTGTKNRTDLTRWINKKRQTGR
ncbi:MAG: response regulator transcription factor [Planctomycetota bacterium]|jgi:FixJ family two-component response regulator